MKYVDYKYYVCYTDVDHKSDVCNWLQAADVITVYQVSCLSQLHLQLIPFHCISFLKEAMSSISIAFT